MMCQRSRIPGSPAAASGARSAAKARADDSRRTRELGKYGPFLMEDSVAQEGRTAKRYPSTTGRAGASADGGTTLLLGVGQLFFEPGDPLAKAFLLALFPHPKHPDEDPGRADEDEEAQQGRVEERDPDVLKDREDARIVQIGKDRKDD
jgi:hypothetical protein